METDSKPLDQANGPAPEMDVKESEKKDPTGGIEPTVMSKVTSDEDFKHQLSTYPSSTLLVIYFQASWAEPCKQMQNVLETLASTYPLESPPKIAFLSVDAEECEDTSEEFEVTAVPFIVLQKDGKKLDTVSGNDVSSVRSIIEKHGGEASGNPGKLGIPAMQKVNKKEQVSLDDKPEDKESQKSNGIANLASYAPNSDDPQTAPDYSSGGDKMTRDELWKRLDELTKAAPIMLFMKGTPSAPQCGFSRQTVSLLRERGLRYGFFNILADDEVRQGLKEYAEWPTFPQLWVKGELIGGLDIVREEFDNDPNFLMEYSSKPQNKTAEATGAGGMTAPEAQES